MTNSQKILIIKLLKGHSLVKGLSRTRKPCYRLLDEKFNPVEVIGIKTVERLSQFIDPKLKLWKQSKSGHITLNLSTVRRLHGRSILKKLYKRRNDLETGYHVVKRKNNRKKIINQEQNEKVLYLF